MKNQKKRNFLYHREKKRIAAIMLAIMMLFTMNGFSTFAMAANDAKVRLSAKKITLTAGKSKKLTVTGAKKANVTWKSSNKKVAAVSSNGKVRAIKKGTANITAAVKFKTGKNPVKLVCKVTVKAKSDENKVPEETAAPAVTPSPAPAPTASPDDEYYIPESDGYQTYAPSAKAVTENNPLLTNNYACDPYAMEYNGRLYVYMTNDSQQYVATDFAGENNYGKIAGIHIISTDDMVNWTDHGIFQITGKTGVCSYMNCCWAPCAAHKTVNGKEKFYIYFTNGGWQLGVVEADSPIGPFRDVKGEALLTANDTSSAPLDPACFIDDNGTAYLAYGSSGGGGRIRKLADDMISFASSEIDVKAPYFFEDSGLNKINGKYYFSYCSDWNERSADYSDLGLCSIAYMVADSIIGPYKYAGDVLPNCGTVFGDWGNNHHSMINFQGKCYMFYHTMVLQSALGCKLGYRSTQVNEVVINDDGTIGQVKQDKEGVSQIKSFNPFQGTSGTTYSNCAGMMSVTPGTDGSRMKAFSHPDRYQYSWSLVKGVDFGETSPERIKLNFTGQTDNEAAVKVCLDSLDGTVIAESKIEADSEGDAELALPVSGITGKHDLYFEFEGNIYNFEKWKCE